jgi:hypothetical protein
LGKAEFCFGLLADFMQSHSVFPGGGKTSISPRLAGVGFVFLAGVV